MSKKIPTRATPKRNAVPLGLQAIFTAMQSQEFQRIYAWTTPDAFTSIPGALQRDPARLTEALKEAANREYTGNEWGPDGNQPASECADVAILAGFWSGVAACWFYMNAINGKDGAR